MKLKLIQSHPIDTAIDLVLISEEHGIYIPKVYNTPLSFLKKGSVIWVKKETHYNVYELTENITDKDEINLILLTL